MRDIRNEENVMCPRAKGMYLENAPDEIWNGGWVLEEKLDGTRDTLQIGSKSSRVVGRNRQDFLKGVQKAGVFREHVHPVFSKIACPELDGTLLDGERTDGRTADGSFDDYTKHRFIEGMFVGYTTWGVMFWKGEDVRGRTEEERYELAKQAVEVLKQKYPKLSIRVVERMEATKENLDKMFEISKEGAIAKKLGMPIRPTQRSNPYWWKLKGASERTIDAFIIGAAEGKSGGSGLRGVKPKPNGKICTLTIAMIENGRIKEVGKMSNLPDEVKEMGVGGWDKFKNRVAEVNVAGWSGKGFRQPRFKKWREDKSPSDCRFDEQVTEKKGGQDA